MDEDPLAWQRAACGGITEIDWHTWLNGLSRIDPYLVWADLSEFAGFGGFDRDGGDGSGGKLPLLVERRIDASSGPLCGPGQALGCALLSIPQVYNDAKAKALRFFTARALPCSIEMLLAPALGIRRFQLGIPRIPDTDEVTPLPPLLVEDRPPVVLGLLDDAVALAHDQWRQREATRFVVAGEPRIIFVWNQSPQALPGWTAKPKQFGYGSELGRDQIRALLAGLGRADDEQRFHDRIGLRAAAWKPATHGQGVLDLFAGYVPPVPVSGPGALADGGDPRGEGRPLPRSAAVSKGQATQAPIIAVQLPSRGVLDTSGGSLGVHALDAMRYVISRARALGKDGPPTRIVTTISYGSIAGPHDGTSMIEQALEELVDTEGPLAIVVAAGNAHRSRTHATLGLKAAHEARRSPRPDMPKPRAQGELEAGDSHELTWRIAPDNPHESFLEIWLDSGDEDAVMVKVKPPGSASPHWLHIGSAWTLHGSGPHRSVPVAGAIYARRVAQGLAGTMVLLSVGPTRPYDAADRDPALSPPFEPAQVQRRPAVPRPAAPAGDWCVEVFNKSNRDIEVHLWTERNDLVGPRRRRQQSQLLDDRRFAINADSSLASLANGSPRPALGIDYGPVLVVGGYRISDRRIATYSSGGPARNPGLRHGPDVEAPSDLGPSVPGLRVAGTQSGQTARLGGTSAAAPLVARWIADHYDQWSNPKSLSKLIATLPQVEPIRRDDDPFWPKPLREGDDDAARRGRRKLD